jgi:hypothetical protein
MEVKATLKPGQNGTKRFLKQYGKQLICVRYRYDKHNHKRQTTIEIIVDEQDWIPGNDNHPDRIVAVKINYSETDLREKVKNAGGYWDIEQKVWLLPITAARILELENRIISTHRL